MGSYIGDAIKMCEGDVEAALTSASYTFEGEYGTGLQVRACKGPVGAGRSFIGDGNKVSQ